jgi:IS6 family transposase
MRFHFRTSFFHVPGLQSGLSQGCDELKAEGQLTQGCWPVKYLNNLIEQDHRFIKRLVKAGLGFFSFPTAWLTLMGYETMNMIRKGQVQGSGVQAQVKFVNSLFGLAA